MENPLPELHLFPRLEKAGHFIKRLVRFLPEAAPDFMSTHYHEEDTLASKDDNPNQPTLWD